MEEIRYPKNLVLSRDNMHAIFDALRAGRSVPEVAAEVAQVASSKKVSRPPTKASSRDPKLSSRGSKSFRPSSRGKSALTIKPTEEPKSAQASSEGVREVSLAIVEQTEVIEKAQLGLARSSEGVSGGKSKSPITEDEEAPGKGKEIVLVEDDVLEAPAQDAPAPVGVRSESGDTVGKTRDKRPAPDGTSAPPRAQKKPRASKGSSPALPPIGKGKNVPVVPLLSSTDNDTLNVADITSQSPANAVAEFLRERMFGGATEASDPRLLALTGFLASSTKEQASFRSRSREELGNTIREMLLMVNYFSLSFGLLYFFLLTVVLPY